MEERDQMVPTDAIPIQNHRCISGTDKRIRLASGRSRCRYVSRKQFLNNLHILFHDLDENITFTRRKENVFFIICFNRLDIEEKKNLIEFHLYELQYINSIIGYFCTIKVVYCFKV